MAQNQELRSDAQLIAASLADPDVFRDLYDRYAMRLHSFFLRRTGGSDAAVDLTAETFAQAWRGRRSFRDRAGGSAGPWLFTIARRLLIRSVARCRIETTMVERLQVELSAWDRDRVSPEPSWLDGIDDDIEAALDQLPRDQRRAVELRVLEELPYATIAERLGCTTTAVRIRVSRGLATVRSRLEGSQG
jgi:RNA polymerase sigma-70 factor (ECF subfamily)